MESRFSIDYDAPQAVRSVIEQIQRAEDVTFSPNNRRLAITDFDRDVIAIADLEITFVHEHGPRVAIADVAEFSSHVFHAPHGVDFIDDDTIIVVSREGDITVHGLPRSDAGAQRVELTPIDLAPGRGFGPVLGPNAVSVAVDESGDAEVLVCNFYGHTVTSHVFHRNGSARCEVTINEVLLCNHLSRPDGVAVSPDGAWIAVSILDPPRLLLYERLALCDKGSDPHAILRGVWHPHGLRFGADSRSLFVADASTPYVHVYARPGSTWRGVHLQPDESVRVIDEDLFQPGLGPGRCGTKGVDIDRSGRVLAVTCEQQPLAFFDVAAILDRSAGLPADHARQLSYELSEMEHERTVEARHQARIASIVGGRSYRLTKPLRSLSDFVKRHRFR